MKKVKVLIIGLCLVILLVVIFLLITGGPRTDVYLGGYEVSNDGEVMTLKVGVASSAGYVRKMKRTSGSMNYYLTFYSTFGINSKFLANDTFDIELDENVEEIYFYTGSNGYKKVLEKDDNGNWMIVGKSSINVEDNINKIVENGPVTSSNPFEYIKASQDIYNELLEYPEDTFKYAIKDLIESNANDGLKSYIEALLCSEINKSFKYGFESAPDFLEHYKEYLTKSYTDFNEYDKYAKTLLK